ncbi:MAG: DUF721 domain-containing protein [Bacteroidota bacterium]|nr:DUF721 domain-containing protein [Bacteroidota bacterium]|tara:strand:- start:147 stop:440 length:294 start_codon:yes stop_codon:yes gene_type:complete
MNKKKNPVSVKNVIDKILLNKKLNNGLLEIRIKDAWKNVMGKNINTFTTDITLNKQIIFVKLSSAPLKNELVYRADTIIKLLNNELGQERIKEIKFH